MSFYFLLSILYLITFSFAQDVPKKEEVDESIKYDPEDSYDEKSINEVLIPNSLNKYI